MTDDPDGVAHVVLSADDLSYLEDHYDVSASVLASELEPLGPASLTCGEVLLSVPAPLEASDFRPEHRDRFVFQFVVGDPRLVVVTALRGGDIEVAQFQFVWTGPHDGLPFRRNGSVAIVPEGWGDTRTRTELLARLVRRVAADRRRSFRRCRFCKDRHPPEWMAEKDVCDACGHEHLGIIH